MNIKPAWHNLSSSDRLDLIRNALGLPYDETPDFIESDAPRRMLLDEIERMEKQEIFAMVLTRLVEDERYASLDYISVGPYGNVWRFAYAIAAATPDQLCHALAATKGLICT